MGLKRNPSSEPDRILYDFVEVSKLDLFSPERWGYTAQWDILLDQVQKIKSVALLLDPYFYDTTLFPIYIDILEANVYIFDDLFYYLLGERIGNEPDLETFLEKGQLEKLSFRLLFWNLDCHDSMKQIHQELKLIEKQIVSFLNQRGLEYIHKCIAEEWYYGHILDDPDYNNIDIVFNKDRAHAFAAEAYFKERFSTPVLKQIIKQIVNALTILKNAITIFGWSYDLPTDSFPILLEQFRKSEKGQKIIKAWERDFDGSRDSLIAKMEKIPELQPWVHRCLHLHDETHAIEQLFYDEKAWSVVNEEEYYNTNNWINILKIVTIIKEYDARQNPSTSTVNKKKSRTIKSFREFIKDAEQTEGVLKKLHNLIGNQTNTDALKVITKAMWIGLLNKPTGTSILNEFPTITCSFQQISRCLNEPKPTHEGLMEKIRKEFE